MGMEEGTTELEAAEETVVEDKAGDMVVIYLRSTAPGIEPNPKYSNCCRCRD